MSDRITDYSLSAEQPREAIANALMILAPREPSRTAAEWRHDVDAARVRLRQVLALLDQTPA